MHRYFSGCIKSLTGFNKYSTKEALHFENILYMDIDFQMLYFLLNRLENLARIILIGFHLSYFYELREYTFK